MTGDVDLLLVEDCEEDAELTLRALARAHLTPRLLRLADGAAALEYLCPPDGAPPPRLPRVILLDLKLPKVDGLEVLQALKNDVRTASIPVVVLTSSREDRDLAEAYRRGANSYIVKPVEFQRFAECIERLGLYWTTLNETVH